MGIFSLLLSVKTTFSSIFFQTYTHTIYKTETATSPINSEFTRKLHPPVTSLKSYLSSHYQLGIKEISFKKPSCPGWVLLTCFMYLFTAQEKSQAAWYKNTRFLRRWKGCPVSSGLRSQFWCFACGWNSSSVRCLTRDWELLPAVGWRGTQFKAKC